MFTGSKNLYLGLKDPLPQAADQQRSGIRSVTLGRDVTRCKPALGQISFGKRLEVLL